MPLSVSNQTEPKNPLKTVVNKTEKVLAPHVTYIFLVCKQANKEKKRSLHYIMISYYMPRPKYRLGTQDAIKDEQDNFNGVIFWGGEGDNI